MGSSSGAPTPRSLSTFSPSVQPQLHAPYPAGPAGYGGYSSTSQPPQLPRSSTVPPNMYASNGRATPAGYSTPGQSPTAASLLPSLISAPAPGSGQSMSLYGGRGGESDGGLLVASSIGAPSGYFLIFHIAILLCFLTRALHLLGFVVQTAQSCCLSTADEIDDPGAYFAQVTGAAPVAPQPSGPSR